MVVRRGTGIEAAAVVSDLEPDAVVVLPEVDPDFGGLGVARDVVERLLGDPIQRGLHVGGQLLAAPPGAPV